MPTVRITLTPSNLDGFRELLDKLKQQTIELEATIKQVNDYEIKVESESTNVAD